MQVNSYLLFNGQCENAFKFYARGLGGQIEAMIPHEGTPAADQVPAEWRGKILHARLKEHLQSYEVLILTGGVSMGKFDLVPASLAACGVKQVFHKVAQRPGKPLWF